jgi:hypothetical protein
MTPVWLPMCGGVVGVFCVISFNVRGTVCDPDAGVI